MNTHEKLNYVELPSRDLELTKKFFTTTFGWEFTDYGPDYTAFADEGLDGGFFRADLASTTKTGAALLVFYSEKLEQTQQKIEQAGGTILKPIFSFPRRTPLPLHRTLRQRIRRLVGQTLEPGMNHPIAQRLYKPKPRQMLTPSPQWQAELRREGRG